MEQKINYPRPLRQLTTSRSLLMFIFLSIITLGIYTIVYFSSISSDINTLATPHDGRKTMHFCLLFFVVAVLTLGIGAIVWFHRISNRIGTELRRRGFNYPFTATDFWVWYIIGILFLVGPFIYIYKLSKSMNLLCENYNLQG